MVFYIFPDKRLFHLPFIKIFKNAVPETCHLSLYISDVRETAMIFNQFTYFLFLVLGKVHNRKNGFSRLLRLCRTCHRSPGWRRRN